SGGHRLWIVAVRQDGRLIALAPLMLMPKRFMGVFRVRVLQFLGSGEAGSDYLNVIIRRGFETVALQGICDYFADNGVSLGLNRTDKECHVLRRLGERLDEQGWRAVNAVQEVCPYI